MILRYIILIILGLVTPKVCFCSEVNFWVTPVFESQKVVLDQEYLNHENDTMSITQCKFYLTNFKFVYKSGIVYSENKSSHLIDLEDTSSFLLHFSNVPEGKLIRIDFSIGVDSLNSVSGAMEGDLDPMLGMYWAWNSGYINAKIEGTHSAISTPTQKFEFHIGGYLRPNRTIQKVQLQTNIKIKKNPINFDLSADLSYWFVELDISEDYHILIPGKKAVMMSTRYKNMFKLKNRN